MTAPQDQPWDTPDPNGVSPEIAPASLESDVPAREGSAGRPRWSKYIGIAFILGFVAYMIVVPAVTLLIQRLTPAPMGGELVPEMSLSEAIRLHSVSGVVMLVFLAAGASVGSFLNVVIYRLPRLRPLWQEPSACPSCSARIAGRDNVPVISWIRLGGRCRECGVSISARYPTIEIVCALIFVGFYYRELLSGGQNLPIRMPNMYNGVVWILFYTKWDLVGLYFFHAVLMVVLLAWGMINYDRFRVPLRASVACTGAFLILAVALPHLNPIVPSWEGRVPFLPASLAISLIGCLGGWTIGAVIEAFVRSPTSDVVGPPVDSDMPEETEIDHEPDEPNVPNTETTSSTTLYGSASPTPTVKPNAAASLALVGAALGIQAVTVVSLLALAIAVLANLFRRLPAPGLRSCRSIPLTLPIFVATLLLLVAWGPIHRTIVGFMSGEPNG